MKNFSKILVFVLVMACALALVACGPEGPGSGGSGGGGGNGGGGNGGGGGNETVYTVTESEWNTAVGLGASDLSVVVKYGTELANLEQNSQFYADGNKIKLVVAGGMGPSTTIYYEIADNIVYSYMDVDGIWVKSQALLAVSDVKLSFDGIFEYGDFTFNDTAKEYTATEIDTPYEGVSYKNIVLKFEDGALVYARYDTYIDGEFDYIEEITISYGSVTVTLPSVGSGSGSEGGGSGEGNEGGDEGGNEGGGQGGGQGGGAVAVGGTKVENANEWQEVLTLNVYGNFEIAQVSKDKDGNLTPSSQYWVESGKIKTEYNGSINYYEKGASEDYVYSLNNGTDWTKAVSNWPAEKYLPPLYDFGFDFALMSYDEDLKAYVADSITLGEGQQYKNVVIALENGKLKSISLDVYVNGEKMQSGTITFTYGTASVVLPDATLSGGGSSTINPSNPNNPNNPGDPNPGNPEGGKGDEITEPHEWMAIFNFAKVNNVYISEFEKTAGKVEYSIQGENVKVDRNGDITYYTFAKDGSYVYNYLTDMEYWLKSPIQENIEEIIPNYYETYGLDLNRFKYDSESKEYLAESVPGPMNKEMRNVRVRVQDGKLTYLAFQGYSDGKMVVDYEINVSYDGVKVVIPDHVSGGDIGGGDGPVGPIEPSKEKYQINPEDYEKALTLPADDYRIFISNKTSEGETEMEVGIKGNAMYVVGVTEEGDKTQNFYKVEGDKYSVWIDEEGFTGWYSDESVKELYAYQSGTPQMMLDAFKVLSLSELTFNEGNNRYEAIQANEEGEGYISLLFEDGKIVEVDYSMKYKAGAQEYSRITVTYGIEEINLP